MSTPRRLLLSPLAAAELEEIADYIARDNLVCAASFVAEQQATCQAVAASRNSIQPTTTWLPDCP